VERSGRGLIWDTIPAVVWGYWGKPRERLSIWRVPRQRLVHGISGIRNGIVKHSAALLTLCARSIGFLCSYYYVYKCTCHCRTFSSADVLHPVRCVDFCFAKYSAYWKNYFWCNGQRPPLLTRGVRRSCDGRKFFLLSYDSGVQVARITNEFVVAPMVASGGVLWWWVSQESGFGRRECVSTFNSLYTEIL
jgi:hypothetical protein